MKMASFEKLKSHLSQTWFIDIIWKPSYVHGVKGHKSRSKVTNQGQRSQIKVKGHLRSTCKIT